MSFAANEHARAAKLMNEWINSLIIAANEHARVAHKNEQRTRKPRCQSINEIMNEWMDEWMNEWTRTRASSTQERASQTQNESKMHPSNDLSVNLSVFFINLALILFMQDVNESRIHHTHTKKWTERRTSLLTLMRWATSVGGLKLLV
jgi:L-serine deaminase